MKINEMENVLLSPIPKEELVSELMSSFRQLLQDHQEENLNRKEWLSAKQTASLIGVTVKTVHSWSDKRILQKHRIGSRIRYRKDEVLHALRKIETK